MTESLSSMLEKKYSKIIKKYQELKEGGCAFSSEEPEDKENIEAIKKLINAVYMIENNEATYTGTGTAEVNWSVKANLLTNSVVTCIDSMIRAELEKDSSNIISKLSHSIGIIYEEFNNLHVEGIIKNYRHNEQHLLASIVSAQENERRRLASILHDDVVQSMVGLLLRFSLLKKQDIDSSLCDELNDMENVLRKTVQMCRVINLETDSFWLEKKGFVAALEIFINNFVQKNEINVELECQNISDDLPNKIETHLFRVIQEALQNVKKHAKASLVNISLKLKDNHVILSVQDDGRGFNNNLLQQKLAQNEIKDHFGLISIEHRTKILNGNLDIYSTPKEGTLLIMTLPLDNALAYQVEKKQEAKNLSTWIKSVKASLCTHV